MILSITLEYQLAVYSEYHSGISITTIGQESFPISVNLGVALKSSLYCYYQRLHRISLLYSLFRLYDMT
jgi:hypothetical protein